MPDPPRRDVPPGRDGDGLFDEIDLPKIAARLVIDNPDDATLRVSHETIYQPLFVQARGYFGSNWCRVCARAGRNAGPVARPPPTRGTSPAWG